MARKDDLGEWGERIAREFLESIGYVIVDCRWRCATGEIDLIARHGSTLAFVEVKTRRTVRFGHPLEAITPAKAARLRLLAGEWCARNNSVAQRVRIDAIGIVGDGIAVENLDHRIGVLT